MQFDFTYYIIWHIVYFDVVIRMVKTLLTFIQIADT